MKPGSRVVHVFLTKRPIDSQEWPAVYSELENQTTTGRERAEAAYGRCSPVITLDFDAELATSDERNRLVEAVAAVRRDHDAFEQMNDGSAPRRALEAHQQRGALLEVIEGLLNGSLRL